MCANQSMKASKEDAFNSVAEFFPDINSPKPSSSEGIFHFRDQKKVIWCEVRWIRWVADHHVTFPRKREWVHPWGCVEQTSYISSFFSQVFKNNLTNHLPVNVQFTLHQLYGHLMVSGHQFKKLLEVLLDFEQLMAAHFLIMFKILTSLFEDMHTKYIFISTFPQTVSSILCFNIHLCCSMTTHKNTTYVLGCYRLTDLELLSLIPQGHKKNRYHCNFFLYGSLPLCLLPNKPY